MTYSKVLVAEDNDSIIKGVVLKLRELGVDNVQHSQFCYDAFLKVKKALKDKNPYQLLVCDLLFTPSSKSNGMSSGQELITAIKKIQPDIKVIVFTVEDKQLIIKSLLKDIKVEAYVCKGLDGLKELDKAIQAVGKNQDYTCPKATAALNQKNVVQLDAYEKQLLQLVANGLKHQEISDHLKSKNISPNSVRSIEDHMSKLRDNFNAATTPQLIFLVHNLGLI